jgi:plasmid maintenance system antidote protein VapI
MTPTQYRVACGRLHISVYASAAALGIHENTAYRYANGQRPIPESIAKLLRALVRLGTIDV